MRPPSTAGFSHTAAQSPNLPGPSLQFPTSHTEVLDSKILSHIQALRKRAFLNRLTCAHKFPNRLTCAHKFPKRLTYTHAFPSRPTFFKSSHLQAGISKSSHAQPRISKSFHMPARISKSFHIAHFQILSRTSVPPQDLRHKS